MKLFHGIIAIFMLSLLTVLLLARALEGGQLVKPGLAQPGQLSETIDRYMQEQIAAWQIPGAALVIVQDGQVTHLRSFGQAGSGQPVTPQTPFEIGSCTKSFTALAIMQFVEAGTVQLDAPVQQYLPWFRVASPEDSARITVRHLLNQTSGIPKDITNRMTMINPWGLSLEGQIRSMRSVNLNAAPGTRYQYSNFNYMVLALIIEAVSGQPYGAYLGQAVFSPMDMQNSFADPSIAKAHGLSVGHTWWFGIPFPSLEGPRTDMLGAGYLMVSPEDMGHYLITQLNGGMYGNRRVLSASGVELMHTPAIVIEGDTDYGMGWTSNTYDGQRVINHNGLSASFTCSMILLPERKTGIAVLANVSSLLGPHAASSLAFQIKDMLVSATPAQVDPFFLRFYLPWDGGFFVATIVIAAPLLYRGFAKKKPQSSSRAWQETFLILDGLLALAAFFGLPLALGWEIWRAMFIWQPDAAFWCLAAGIFLLARFTWRLFGLLRKKK